MAIDSKIYKATSDVANKLEGYIEQELFETLTASIEEVKEVVVDSYTQILVNVVMDRDSRTRPEDYLEEFTDRLDNFEYVIVEDGQVSFNVPDIQNFDFSGRLRVIENILEGVIGQYVEVTGDMWIKIFGKTKLPTDPVDNAVPVKERVYLLKYNQFVKNKEKELGVKLVKYPFSNTGPIDIFRGVNAYVSERIPIWINEAIIKAQKRLNEAYE